MAGAASLHQPMTLAELIDLELTLFRDRALPADALWERDGRIAADIGDTAASDTELLQEWVRWVRAGGSSEGDRVVRAQRAVGRLAAAAGAVLGATGAAGWLATSDRLPVNVVNFWPVFVGLPLLLLAVWTVIAIGGASLSWVPMRGAAGLLARLVGERERLADDWRAFESIQARLGRLPFWAASRIGHGFALAFQAGALAALLFVPVVDDPAFGWRSRVLEDADVTRAAAVVAAPWQGWWTDAAPTAAVVSATRYSSVTPDLERGDANPWAAWWPFLLASLLLYGVALRMLAWGGAVWAARRAVAGALTADDLDRRRLIARLRAPRVETRADGEEASGVEIPPARARTLQPDWSTLRCGLFDFGGVSGAVLDPRLRSMLGGEPIGLWEVGGLDVGGERAALEEAAAARIEAAVVMLAAWDPPVGDHEEWVGALVDRLGAIPVGVWFAGSGEVEERHRSVWAEWAARRRGTELFLLDPEAAA